MAKADFTKLNALGSRIRAARTHRGISQDRLADLAGIDRSFVSRLERGKANPTFLTLLKLSNALETDIAAIVASEDQIEEL